MSCCLVSDHLPCSLLPPPGDSRQPDGARGEGCVHSSAVFPVLRSTSTWPAPNRALPCWEERGEMPPGPSLAQRHPNACSCEPTAHVAFLPVTPLHDVSVCRLQVSDHQVDSHVFLCPPILASWRCLESDYQSNS